MRSGERRGECGKEAAARAALKGGEVEAAARLLRAERRRQKRGVGGRGVGRRAFLEGGEEAVSRRDAYAVFFELSTVDHDACACVLQHCRALEQKQLSVVSLRAPR